MSLLTYCSRCGQHITNVHVYDGLPYGGDCVEVVSGVRRDRWEMRRLAGVSNPEDAHAEALAAEARRERDRLAFAKWEAEASARRSAFAPALDMLADAGLIAPVGTGHMIDPAANQWLASVSRDMRDGLDISERTRAIVCEIYGKAFGRRGSNKYWAAYEKLADAFNAHPAMA